MNTRKSIFIESLSKLGLSQNKFESIVNLVEGLEDITSETFTDENLNHIIDDYETGKDIDLRKMFTYLHRLEDMFHETHDEDCMAEINLTYIDYCMTDRKYYTSNDTSLDIEFEYFDKQYLMKYVIGQSIGMGELLDDISDFNSELCQALIEKNISPEECVKRLLNVLETLFKYIKQYMNSKDKTTVENAIAEAHEYLR